MITHTTNEEAVWIRLERPEKMNALHLDGWEELATTLETASEKARVAVITGTEDVFCAGDDIETLDSLDTVDDVNELAEKLYDVLFGIEELSIPVITAVNGLAYGGGCELVAASDIAVAVEDAAFALPETRIGAYPPYAVERIASVGGKKRGMELALTGQPIDAQTAHEWGLTNRVVPRGELEGTVEEFIELITESPKESIRLTKRYAHYGRTGRGNPDRIAGALARVAISEECNAAARAFLEGNTD